MMPKDTAPIVALAGAIILAAAAPFLGDYTRYVFLLWLIYSLAAIGLNFTMGYGHLYAMGQGAFVLIGAYVTGVALTRWQWSPEAAFLFAVASATVAGFAIGLPAIRLRHFSLAIVTFAFATMLFNLVKSFAYTGGPQGLFLDVTEIQNLLGGTALFYVALLANGVALMVFISITRSKSGRALRIIGVNETVARSFGINVTLHKVVAFALSAAAGAMAGSLHAFATGFVGSENYGPELSVALLAAVLIGGKGSLLGPFVGAAFVVGVPEITQDARALAQVLYGVLFIICVTLLPKGLFSLFSMLPKPVRSQSTQDTHPEVPKVPPCPF